MSTSSSPSYTTDSKLVKNAASTNLQTRFELTGNEGFNDLVALLVDDLNNCNLKTDLAHVIQGLKKATQLHKREVEDQKTALRSQINELKKDQKKAEKDAIKKEKEIVKQTKKETIEGVKAKRRNAANVLNAPMKLSNELAEALDMDPEEPTTRQMVIKRLYKVDGVKSVGQRELLLPDTLKAVFGPPIYPLSKKDDKVCYSFFNIMKYLTGHLTKFEGEAVIEQEEEQVEEAAAVEEEEAPVAVAPKKPKKRVQSKSKAGTSVVASAVEEE